MLLKDSLVKLVHDTFLLGGETGVSHPEDISLKLSCRLILIVGAGLVAVLGRATSLPILKLDIEPFKNGERESEACTRFMDGMFSSSGLPSLLRNSSLKDLASIFHVLEDEIVKKIVVELGVNEIL